MKRLLGAAIALLGLGAMQAPTPLPSSAPPPLSLWRLDCGAFQIKDFGGFFSDTFAYPTKQPKKIVSSCYLVRHGDRYMLWDTGLTAKLAGRTHETPDQTMSLGKSIIDQLKQINVRPDQIELIGISHHHGDHTGQAANFPKAKLVMGKADLDVLRGSSVPEGSTPVYLKPWLEGSAPLLEATGDVDLFQDGRVVMLSLPGHTPGHYALLVRLASGPVLLSGDLYHFTEQVPIRGVPPFNSSRAETLASMDRFDKIARNLGAKVVIQHEPADIAKLPIFPASAS
jgi:glyoxylase-like metal-dependent hydrolase (beta-lactamase superfamily II)